MPGGEPVDSTGVAGRGRGSSREPPPLDRPTDSSGRPVRRQCAQRDANPYDRGTQERFGGVDAQGIADNAGRSRSALEQSE